MKLKKLYDEYQTLTKHYHPSLIVAGIEYYLMLVIIPVWYLLKVVFIYMGFEVFITSENNTIETITGIKNVSVMSVLLVVNIIIITSRFIKSLTKASDIVFNDKPRKNYLLNLKNYLVSFIIILMAISLSALTLTLIKLTWYLDFRWLSEILRLVMPFFLFWFIISVIFKYVIPIKVKYKDAFKICFVINAYYYVAAFIYRFIVKMTLWNKYTILYVNVAFVIIFLYFLYTLIYLFLFGLIWYYKKNKTRI